MSDYFLAYSAVFPLIIRNTEECQQVLLHRRENTGYRDGQWDFAGSGHVDVDEMPRHAVVRECNEELGIDVMMKDVTFAHASYHRSVDRTYYDLYFVVRRYAGKPTIMEPDKCSGLEWFDIDHLPDDMIDCRRQILLAYRRGDGYSEILDNF